LQDLFKASPLNPGINLSLPSLSLSYRFLSDNLIPHPHWTTGQLVKCTDHTDLTLHDLIKALVNYEYAGETHRCTGYVPQMLNTHKSIVLGIVFSKIIINNNMLLVLEIYV